MDLFYANRVEREGARGDLSCMCGSKKAVGIFIRLKERDQQAETFEKWELRTKVMFPSCELNLNRAHFFISPIQVHRWLRRRRRRRNAQLFRSSATQNRCYYCQNEDMLIHPKYTENISLPDFPLSISATRETFSLLHRRKGIIIFCFHIYKVLIKTIQ